MIYSHEVEMMCPVAQGANHGRESRTSSDPGRGEMGKGEGNQGHFRSDTRRRLVCTSAGNM